jgi:hypothetical protein
MFSTGAVLLITLLALSIGAFVGAAVIAWTVGQRAEERESLLERELVWWRRKHDALAELVLRMKQEGPDPASPTAAASGWSGRQW